jgi:MarR-like DNA-binding transcriptional regulator SgrR of sgrS sRNA
MALVGLVGCSIDRSSLQSVAAPKQAERQAIEKALQNRATQVDVKISIQKIEYVGQFTESSKTVDLWHVSLTVDGEPVTGIVAVVLDRNGKIVRILILSGETL